jgi:hypothetical protein
MVALSLPVVNHRMHRKAVGARAKVTKKNRGNSYDRSNVASFPGTKWSREYH